MDFLYRVYLVAFFFVISFVICAQESDFEIAEEYFSSGEYEKAIIYYEKVNQQNEIFYEHFFKSLIETNKLDVAQKLIKKFSKNNKEEVNYLVDEVYLNLIKKELETAKKNYLKIVSVLKSSFYINRVANRFLKYYLYDYALKTYEIGNNITNNEGNFSYQIADIYIQQNEKKKFVDFTINQFFLGYITKSYIENTFQNYLETNDYNDLEKIFLVEIQKQPNNLELNELIIWLYYQKKDFQSALFQAKALDRKLINGGAKTMEVGEISFKNYKYETAIEAFQYIIDNYKVSSYYLPARKKLLEVREKLVLESYPTDSIQVDLLINDYQSILSEFGRGNDNGDVLRKIATIYAFYKNEIPKAIQILEELISIKNLNKKLLSEAKLDLADIYILNKEPWEATLLYYQVELDNNDSPLGHIAKLKNAKLSFYKGDFELALSHLKILKLATSREIANDALDLSMLIVDNSGLDTSYDALNSYAQIELLIFRNLIDSAFFKIQEMETNFQGHSLTDELYFSKFKLYNKLGQYDKSIYELEKIIKNYEDDILGDDAVFNLAELFEKRLNNKEKAMEFYLRIITNHADSIYLEEARNRYRALRGDKI